MTGTVECIPLICSSIMSKKLAEGLDSLVSDVKFGRGAFMKSKTQALELARALVAIGHKAGKPMRALLTCMDQPLGRAAGHTTEVIESIECLKGRGPADLMEVTFALTGHMLILGGLAKDMTEAQGKMSAAIASGAALQKFRDMCTAQGGDARVVDDYKLLPTAKKFIAVKAPADAKGFVSEVDSLKCGHAISLRRRARMDHLLICGYCNDYQQYFPTIEAISEGGYGTAPPIAVAEPGAGERMTDRALLQLYKLRGLSP